MINKVKVNTLQVDGASLYYEVRGSGPILLLISGGPGDASAYNELFEYLVDKYTVVTYDRRGYTRSKIDDPSQELRLEMESDDVHRLLAAFGNGSAYVFGNSIGAVIAIDLVARHPKQVRTLVAHEPPAHSLTSSKTDVQQPLGEIVQKILERDGPTAAVKAFAEMADVNLDFTTAPKTDNAMFFMQKEAPLIDNYRFDFVELNAAKRWTRIVIAAGSTSSRNSFGYLGAVAISERLGTDIVEFPGDHVGMGRNPKEFAQKLGEVLGD